MPPFFVVRSPDRFGLGSSVVSLEKDLLLKTHNSQLKTYGQAWTQTSVPNGAQSKSQVAKSSGRFTQPWLIGVPKLLCQ